MKLFVRILALVCGVIVTVILLAFTIPAYHALFTMSFDFAYLMYAIFMTFIVLYIIVSYFKLIFFTKLN